MIPELWDELFDTENGCSIESVQQAEMHLGTVFPLILRHFYIRYGNHPLHQAHNRLILPQNLQNEKGFVVFYEENQGVVLWAIAVADFVHENPVVYESYDNGETWILHEDKERLADFLTDVSLFQAIMGGFPFTSGHFGLNASVEEKIRNTFAQLSGYVAKRGMRYYGKPSELIAIMEGEESNDLWIACRKKADFRKLCRQLQLDWDYNSLEET
jgi:hypothetical protein